MQNRKDTDRLLVQAASGDPQALEELLAGVWDDIFHLALRMLGNVEEAKDAVQDIMLKVIRNLSGFRRESSFGTWVYRISVNHLADVIRSRTKGPVLSFEIFEKDIMAGFTSVSQAEYRDVDEGLLAEELKLSCTNMMLQCLKPETRAIFVFGTMFRADSRVAAEIFGITPAAYRQKLSRAKKRMAGFLAEYCGLSGTGNCSCKKRVDYAIRMQRLDPEKLEYLQLEKVKSSMETIDDLSGVFTSLPCYKSPVEAKVFLENILLRPEMKQIQQE